MKIVLLDAGHGGLINGIYQTAGKRSCIWEDGEQYFEGVGNRLIRFELAKLLDNAGIKYAYINKGNRDVSLRERAKIIRSYENKYGVHNCLVISIHSDAHQQFYIDKKCTIKYSVRRHGARDWKTLFQKPILEPTDATGFSVYTTRGTTNSDKYAERLLDEMKKLFPNEVMRTDTTDGDKDKEANFAIIKNTRCPAILSENFFMTNKKDCRNILMTEQGRYKIAKAHFNMIKNYYYN